MDPASLGLDWLAGPLAFFVTDIDDLFVLVALLADTVIRPRHVVIGQYAGIAFLIAVSGLAMVFRLVVPVPLIGLLGVLPLVLGIREAVELARARRGGGDDADDPRQARPTPARRPGIIGIAMVTIANGGDNIAVYVPLFASSTPVRAAGLAGIFLAMTGVWLCLAWFTVHNPLCGRHLQRWGHRLLPPVLILLGVLILWENGTFAWLAGLAS